MHRKAPNGRDMPILRQEEFRLLGEIVSRFCGIQLTENNRLRVQRLLGPRLKTLGLSSFLEYCRYLTTEENAEAEYFRLAETVANNETYFFREEYQLRTFAEEVLPLLAKKNRHRKRITLWSAGCSSGEEPYTLAMLVMESGLFDDSWNIRILGTDISARVLAKARRGVYGPSSFRNDRARDPHILQTYFRETKEGMAVTERLRGMVGFARTNLVTKADLHLIPPVDVVFCRNVLIYFPDHVRRKVVSFFHDRLRTGGYLFLGHSENLLSMTTNFECVRLATDLVYQKADPLRATEPLANPQEEER